MREKTIEEIQSKLGEQASADCDFIDKPFSRNEIMQKAFNIVANRNRREEERARTQQLRDRQGELVREMLDDVIVCLRNEVQAAMRYTKVSDMQASLKKVFAHTERA